MFLLSLFLCSLHPKSNYKGWLQREVKAAAPFQRSQEAQQVPAATCGPAILTGAGAASEDPGRIGGMLK